MFLVIMYSNCNCLSSAHIPDNDTATLISYKSLQK